LKKIGINSSNRYAGGIIATSIFLAINTALAQDFTNRTLHFKFKPSDNLTQFVIWFEDSNNQYLTTVYITNFIGRRGGGNRTSDPDIDSNTGNRLSTFPIWAYRRGVIDTTYGIENYYPPAETQPSYPGDIDAVSGATPGASIQTRTWQLSDLPSGEYNCWIEVNQSFDQNQSHDYSWYRGQPSVVWQVSVNVSDTADTSRVLDYTGYGSPDGSNREINPPDSTITTATNLLSDLGGYKFEVIYLPGGIAEVEQSHNLPDTVPLLEQNYPNPFNSTTDIKYFLPSSGQVKLTIYDIQGREIGILVNQRQSAGSYQVVWDGRNSLGEKVESGIYLYRLRAGEFSRIRKMVFLK